MAKKHVELTFDKIVLRNNPELEALVAEIRKELHCFSSMPNTDVVKKAMNEALKVDAYREMATSIRNKYQECRLQLESLMALHDQEQIPVDISREILTRHDKDV